MGNSKDTIAENPISYYVGETVKKDRTKYKKPLATSRESTVPTTFNYCRGIYNWLSKRKEPLDEEAQTNIIYGYGYKILKLKSVIPNEICKEIQKDFQKFRQWVNDNY